MMKSVRSKIERLNDNVVIAKIMNHDTAATSKKKKNAATTSVISKVKCDELSCKESSLTTCRGKNCGKNVSINHQGHNKYRSNTFQWKKAVTQIMQPISTTSQSAAKIASPAAVTTTSTTRCVIIN
jgi:hypothetical protein